MRIRFYTCFYNFLYFLLVQFLLGLLFAGVSNDSLTLPLLEMLPLIEAVSLCEVALLTVLLEMAGVSCSLGIAVEDSGVFENSSHFGAVSECVVVCRSVPVEDFCT